MADSSGVTYADLRFAKRPPDESRPPGEEAHQEASDGELTYENFSTTWPARPGPDPAPPQEPAGAGRQTCSGVRLAVLGIIIGLFLLTSCLGLGVRYWQVSRQLAGASRRHEAESSALAQRLGDQEERLSRAQTELNATRRALWQSWQAGNFTRRRLEEEREAAEDLLAALRQEKARVVEELEAARSCPQRGCCPSGWALFWWKCLWVSQERMSWERSWQDCARQGAQLLMLKQPWEDAATPWDADEAILSHLHSGEFWIGLKRPNYRREWLWIDGTPYTGRMRLQYHSSLA